jgi:hypothetical protein
MSDINIDSLTSEQKSVQDFLWNNVGGKLDGSTLIAGEQVGNTFTYRYLGANIPRTLTDYTVNKNKRTNGEEYMEVARVVSSSTVGGLENGSRVTTTKTVRRGSEDFAEAVRIANF